jgi:hypothetical protein
MTRNPFEDRSALWLSLLRRLTERFPRWAVWKNVGSALTGPGDVDSLAPPEDWPAIEVEFRAWAAENGLGPLIVCRHVPQGPHFIALQEGSPYLMQLDVKVRGTFRGSTLIDVPSLLALSELDAEGFRRVRPGAEGVIKLASNGTRRWGRKNADGLLGKGVVELLQRDPEGVRAAAALLFGPASGAFLSGADSVVRGEWDRGAMLTAEAWALLRSAAEPWVPASRAWFDLVGKKRCPVLRAIREGNRRIPGERADWLREVATTHHVSAGAADTRAASARGSAGT